MTASTPTTATDPGREAPFFGALLWQEMQRYTAKVEEALAPLEDGLTRAQVQVLDAVKSHPLANQTQLVAVTGIDRSTLADIVRRLVGKQLLSRKRTKEDARAYAVKLTPDGTAALAAARKAIQPVDKALRPQILSTLQATA